MTQPSPQDFRSDALSLARQRLIERVDTSASTSASTIWESGGVPVTHKPYPPIQKKLEALRRQILRMGHLAEALLDKALRSVWQRDAVVAGEVQIDDLAIDRLDVEIDQAVLELLALQAPVAKDLREVVAIKTSATDLERVGDIARNIAKGALRMSERAPAPPPALLVDLAAASQRMLRNALRALADRDSAVAREVLAADDQLDADEDRAIRAAIEEIRNDPEGCEQEIDWIMTAKNLERVGDHATNIAEDVILVCEALNLKHAEKLVS